MLFRPRVQDPGHGGGGWLKRAREWTFMVYLAADNNLDELGRSDLEEMKGVGSGPELAIVAQWDRRQAGATKRYCLRHGTRLQADEVADLGETNTGDPKELARFMLWAMRAYPAKRYALVLWNHGTGWKEDDLYQVAERAGVYPVRGGAGESAAPLGSLIARIAERGPRGPLFSSSIGSILARGIAYDDTARDLLDNAELKQAVSTALTASGESKLALLGFDACLMSMLEVVYQVKDVVRCVVGAQDWEPVGGWPYNAILSELAAKPSMDEQELATAVVRHYMGAYASAGKATQSALDLGHIREVVSALNELCVTVLSHRADCRLAVGYASRRAQQYADADYKDLYDFCRLLGEGSELIGLPEMAEKARAVLDALAPTGKGRFVLAEGHCGQGLEHSHGVSIYFPVREVSPFYRRLDFASETYWDELLQQVLGT